MQVARQGVVGRPSEHVQMSPVSQHDVAVTPRRRRARAPQQVLRAHAAPSIQRNTIEVSACHFKIST